MEDEAFYQINHTEKFKRLYEVLFETKKIPSVLPFVTKRITEKEFVKYLNFLISYKKDGFGDLFFNYLLKELEIRGEFKINRTSREMPSHNRADLVVECNNLNTFIFEFKLDGYVESEDQTHNHVSRFEKNFPNHKPFYFFIDSKGEKARNEKFSNFDLKPFKFVVKKMINEISSEADILSLNIFLEVLNDLQQRAE